MNASPHYLSRIEFGLHVVTGERNGILHLLLRGSLSEAEAVGIKKAMVDYGKQHPAYHCIADVSEMTGLTGGARRTLVVQDRYPFSYSYVVGASFAIRVLITGILRARRLLQPNAIIGTTITVKSEEEARRLIAAYQLEKKTA